VLSNFELTIYLKSDVILLCHGFLSFRKSVFVFFIGMYFSWSAEYNFVFFDGVKEPCELMCVDALLSNAASRRQRGDGG
jgi:hypothetical protein